MYEKLRAKVINPYSIKCNIIPEFPSENIFPREIGNFQIFKN